MIGVHCEAVHAGSDQAGGLQVYHVQAGDAVKAGGVLGHDVQAGGVPGGDVKPGGVPGGAVYTSGVFISIRYFWIRIGLT